MNFSASSFAKCGNAVIKGQFMIKFNSLNLTFLTSTTSYINILYLYNNGVVCATYQMTFINIAFHCLSLNQLNKVLAAFSKE